jgi:hypothetical protein
VLAVRLSSTAKWLRELMHAQLVELKRWYQLAVAMAVAWDKPPPSGYSSDSGVALRWQLRFAQLHDIKLLEVGIRCGRFVTLTHWKTLGKLASYCSLPNLQHLCIDGCRDNANEGVASLAAGLRRGALPSLQRLSLADAQIGPLGASALAPALTTLPSLDVVRLARNPIGDDGLAPLAPALRACPKLWLLDLAQTQISDQGLTSLLAEGVLTVLEKLWLESGLWGLDNQITEEGCIVLASALRSGVLPALQELNLQYNPASDQAQRAVLDARPNLYSLRYGSEASTCGRGWEVGVRL